MKALIISLVILTINISTINQGFAESHSGDPTQAEIDAIKESLVETINEIEDRIVVLTGQSSVYEYTTEEASIDGLNVIIAQLIIELEEVEEIIENLTAQAGRLEQQIVAMTGAQSNYDYVITELSSIDDLHTIISALVSELSDLVAGHQVTFEIAGNLGTLNGHTLQRVADGGSTTAVLVIPPPGLEFARWSDNSRENPRVVENVTSDRVVTAYLRQAFIPFQYRAGTGGYIVGEADQFIQPGGETSLVTAVANENFVFSHWSDERKDNPRVDYDVTEATFLTAVFRPTISQSYDLKAGWSLISVPLTPLSYEPIEGITSVLRWENGEYKKVTDWLVPIKGHWVFAPRDIRFTIEGFPIKEDGIEYIYRNESGKMCIVLPEGWHPVGTRIYTYVPPNVFPVWSYDRSFLLEARFLEPGKAYWVHVPEETYFPIE